MIDAIINIAIMLLGAGCGLALMAAVSFYNSNRDIIASQRRLKRRQQQR